MVVGSTVLALKKNVRRSSGFDKIIKTKKNDEVFMVEAISSTDSITASSSSNSNPSYKIMNETPIIVSDSDSSKSNLCEKESIRVKSLKTSEIPAINNGLLSDKKIKEINRWLDSINDNKLHEITKYSELSTIYGDEDGDFQPKESGNAVSSTFIGSQSKRFDEFFKKSVGEEQKVKHLPQLIVEDSFEICDKERNHDVQISQCSDIDRYKSIEESIHSTELLKENYKTVNENIEQKTPICMLN